MHLHQGYVSIAEVVKAIAICIAPPPNYEMLVRQWDDADRRPIEVHDTSAVQKEMLEWLERHKMRGLLPTISDAFRYSEAAAVLDQHFQNAQERGPRWFDVSVTGRPRRSDDVHKEATSILLYMTKSWVRYERAFHEGRLNGWPNCDFDHIEGFYGSAEAYKRFDEIMFDRREIVIFLAEFGIKNSGLDHGTGDDEVAVLSSDDGDESTESQGPWLSNSDSLIQKFSDAAKCERKRGLSTNEMAAAFGDTAHDRHKTSRDHAGWLQYLQGSLRPWAMNERIRIAPGGPGRGRSAEWDPVEFAKKYVSKDFNGRWRAFNERFVGVDALKPWRQAWMLWVIEQKGEV
ncbi:MULTISPECIES: hypothetical protein [Burkholderia]|uniref:hypothetical protein n=2 Tax=Burkholderiaceae TaxID=119060 RepID=UPI00158E1FEE|nr:hypothetical protein [Burkholderia ambifaria]